MTYYDYDGTPISLDEWALLFEGRSKDLVRWKVAETQVTEDIRVSTVWMGIDHNYGRGPPLIFETMVFGGPLDDTCRRYSTAAEAQKGHEEIVALVKLELTVGEEVNE